MRANTQITPKNAQRMKERYSSVSAPRGSISMPKREPVYKGINGVGGALPGLSLNIKGDERMRFEPNQGLINGVKPKYGRRVEKSLGELAFGKPSAHSLSIPYKVE